MSKGQSSSHAVRWILVVMILSVGCWFSGGRSAIAQTASPAAAQGRADNEYQVGALLWTQSSAEYRALAYQTFLLARLRLDQDLIHHRIRRGASPRAAVIVDVDETVMDNSRYQAELVLRRLPYETASWRAWCERAEAGAVPGAIDFLSYAARRGMRVFYITNRRQPEKAGTVANLKKLGFPDVSEESVMVREDGMTSSKESRRQKVARRYRIALLIGDNLNDFNDNFAGKAIPERAAQVDLERAQFGTRFIVVPNPMYGDWESAVYQYKSLIGEEQKRAYRRAGLKGL
ncbi:MAG TPA: 5'-nucleotidase, lipoprotein e(P4) family [Pyrinomonadaceae bacterium]|nr:5'-nucleotidase, lipoprotein e(P4) family [Pyrinomonadaceae bacterium]